MAHPDDELVEFLLRETGERLHAVVEHDPDSWQFLYVSDSVHDRVEHWQDHLDELIDQFRDDARRNQNRKQLFDVGEFYCSLHLFDDLLIIHFSQPDGQGVIFGYNPAAASNLTTFVELCLPHIRQHALEDVGGLPQWSE